MLGTSIVGRARELAALAGWLDQAAAGRGTIGLVSGEPGIGKTRLLEEAAERAQARGFAIAWGRAWEVSSAPPHWPWIEALRALFARPGGRAGADSLVHLLPELDHGVATPLADPFPLYDAVVGYLHVCSTREPILVVLDDLHAADPSSLRLAELVAAQLRRMRVAVLGSYRDVEARLSPAIESALVRLGRRGETVALHRLGVADVGELVREALGRDEPETARMIHGASEGNPLFVRELLKLLSSRGAVGGDVPAGVRAVIRERLALLAPATVALLQAAACVGRTFGIALAADVAGVTPAALEEAVAEAATAEVVALVEPGRYRFSLTPVVRARLHRRAAETLARRHAGDPGAPFAEIAHHWLAAGSDAIPEALAAVERAAAAAEARVAFADAAELYERANALLASHAPGEQRRRAEYLIRQGENLVRGGERDRAKPVCVAASEIANALGDGVMYARSALALGADITVGLIDPTLIHLLERALELLPADDDPWRAQVMARLAAARQPAGDTREPIALAHEAIAMARRLGDADVLYEVLFRALGALVDFERPEIRAPLNAEVVRMAARAGDRGRELRSLQRLAFDMIDLGDLAGYERTLAQYEVTALATGQPRYQWVPLLFRAMRAHWEGRLDDDRRLADEAFAIREQLGEPIAVMQTARRSMRDVIPVDELDRVSLVVAGTPDFARVIRAWSHARAGRLAEARADADWMHAQPVAMLGTHVGLHAAGMVAQLAWYLRDRTIAERVHPRIELEHGRPFMTTSFAFLCAGVFDHELMRLAGILGRWDDVERWKQSALALCAKLGATPIADQIHADHAALLAERGLPIKKPSTPAAAEPIELHQEGEFWTVRGLGELCRVKDSRGIQMLAKLIATPNQELHVLELSGAELVDGGDAGEILDDDARDAYRDRLRALQRELEQAEAWNDAGRRARIEAEIEALTTHLANAFGLGGRQRRTGSASERARQNVRRRIADAMQRIGDACPALGRHLARAIRTGTTCAYEPDR
jgi:AAA ATPase-like protein